MKPLKNLKTLGRLGKGTALLVAKPLSLREALQTLEICAKANVAILPQGDPTWNKIMAFVCRCLDVFVVVPKKQPGKMNDDHSQGSRMSTTKSRINNNNHQQRQQQQQQKVLCLVVWDIFDLTHLDLGCWWCCVQPSWKLISSRLNTQQVEDVDARS